MNSRNDGQGIILSFVSGVRRKIAALCADQGSKTIQRFMLPALSICGIEMNVFD